MNPPSPATQLNGFIAKFSPEIAALGKAVLARLRRLLPPSVEMVYDNYNFLVVGFGPTERPSEAVLSVAFYARGVGLCFIQGARLPDPDKLLLGGGNQVRHIKLPQAGVLDDPRVRQLIAIAVKSGPTPFAKDCRRKLIIKSISAKQRPRRPPPAKK